MNPGSDLLWAGLLGALVFLTAIVLFTMAPGRSIKICVGASTLAVILVPVARLEAGSAGLRAATIVGLLVLTGVAVFRSGGFRMDAVGGLVVVLVALTGAVATYSPFPGAILQWALISATLVCGYVQGAILYNLNLVSWASRTFVTIAVVFGLYAIVESAFGLQPLWRGGNIRPNGESIAMASTILPGLSRAQATLAHPLPLAFILLLALAVALIVPARRRSRQLLTVAVLLGGMVATGSRNALVFALLVLLVAWARRLNHARVLIYMLAVASVGVGLALLINSNLVETGSFTHRVGALESVNRLFGEQSMRNLAFGTGADGIIDLFSRGVLQDDGLHAVDNQYVFSLAASGVVGLLATVAAFVIAALRGSEVVRLGVAVIALQAVVFDLLAWPATALLAWMLVGMAGPKTRALFREIEADRDIGRSVLSTTTGGQHARMS